MGFSMKPFPFFIYENLTKGFRIPCFRPSHDLPYIGVDGPE